MSHLHSIIRLLLLLSAVLLGLGLVAPCMTVQPAFGTMEGWVRLLKPDLLRPSQYSILSGIFTLIGHGNAGIGLLLLGFSVIFPTLKLAAMAWGAERIAAHQRPGWVLHAAHVAGKWSMLDVMVLGLLVIAIKGLPGNTTISIGWGVYAFAASVALALIISSLIARLEKTAALPARAEEMGLGAPPVTDAAPARSDS